MGKPAPFTFTKHVAGEFDQQAARADLQRAIGEASAAGYQAILVAEDGKRIPLDANLTDPKGQRWGVLPMAMSGWHVEFEPRANAAGGNLPVEDLRQVAQQLGLSAAGSADALRQRIEGFLDALRQELAAAQHVLRNNPTPARLPIPRVEAPAPVAQDVGRAASSIPTPPTATALGQTAPTEASRPAAPTRVDADTAVQLPAPAPIGAAQTPLVAPSPVAGGQTPLVAPFGIAGLGTLQAGAGAAVAPAPPQPSEAPTAPKPQPKLTPPAPVPTADKGLQAPGVLFRLLTGASIHGANLAGSVPIAPGLTADRLLSLAGMHTFAQMTATMRDQLAGSKSGGWAQVLGLGGSNRPTAEGPTPEADRRDVLTDAILKLIESVDALNEAMRKEKAEPGLDQKTGKFTPTLGRSAPPAQGAPSGGANHDGTGSDMMHLLWESMKAALAAL